MQLTDEIPNPFVGVQTPRASSLPPTPPCWSGTAWAASPRASPETGTQSTSPFWYPDPPPREPRGHHLGPRSGARGEVGTMLNLPVTLVAQELEGQALLR